MTDAAAELAKVSTFRDIFINGLEEVYSVSDALYVIMTLYESRITV